MQEQPGKNMTKLANRPRKDPSVYTTVPPQLFPLRTHLTAVSKIHPNHISMLDVVKNLAKNEKLALLGFDASSHSCYTRILLLRQKPWS